MRDLGHPIQGDRGLDYLWAVMGTDAEWFSHARVRVPLPPPSSSSVYIRFSTIVAGLLIFILVLPRSCDPS